MTRPVLSKEDMYRRLRAGEFGNTQKMWETLPGWLDDIHPDDPRLWMVRSLRAGGPYRPNVPTVDLPAAFAEIAAVVGVSLCNITPMIPDADAVLRGELYDSPTGLVLHAVLGGGEPWRKAMNRARPFGGVVARRVMEHFMTPASYDDVWELLDRFRGHVIEIGVYRYHVGTLEHRNCIIWEVRCGESGRYESWLLR